MAGSAAFTLVHIRHGHFRAAFLHGEEIRMALIACKGGMTGVTEIRRQIILDWIHQRCWRRRGASIFMASVTVIERFAILPGMAAKAGILRVVIGKTNFCDTLLERKKRRMATAAFKFCRMGLMAK